MAYKSRIPAEAEYLRSLGCAFYNFTYLEWVVVWTIVKLSADGFDSVPRGKSASHIARALVNAVAKTTPPLPEDLRRRLIQFREAYLGAIRHRNKLLHAHPYTAADGAQQLGGGGVEWPGETVDQAAKFFGDTAIMGNEIFQCRTLPNLILARSRNSFYPQCIPCAKKALMASKPRE